MKVDVTRKGQAGTLATSVTEYVTQMMTLYGIEMLETKEHRMGLASGLVTYMTPSTRCPAELADAAAAVKDALGTLLASIGATAIQVSLSKDERDRCVESWKRTVEEMPAMLVGGGAS